MALLPSVFQLRPVVLRKPRQDDDVSMKTHRHAGNLILLAGSPHRLRIQAPQA